MVRVPVDHRGHICSIFLPRISGTATSAPAFELMDFCLISVPFGNSGEPEILRYAITSIGPIGADVRQFVGKAFLGNIGYVGGFAFLKYSAPDPNSGVLEPLTSFSQ